MSDKPSGKLGFKYSREVAQYVDAEEYRQLLSSGRLTEDEAAWMRQFLAEYYGRPTKKQLKIHSQAQNKDLCKAQDARRRDLANQRASSTQTSKRRAAAYSAQDYPQVTESKDKTSSED